MAKRRFNPYDRITDRVQTVQGSAHPLRTYWQDTDSRGYVWENYQMSDTLVARQLVTDFEGNEYPVLCSACIHCISQEDEKIICTAFESEQPFDPIGQWPVRHCDRYSELAVVEEE